MGTGPEERDRILRELVKSIGNQQDEWLKRENMNLTRGLNHEFSKYAEMSEQSNQRGDHLTAVVFQIIADAINQALKKYESAGIRL